MTSLAPSSSVAFPAPVALAHSYNSRGELGMFVNPYSCSCATCVDYVAERSSPAAEEDAPAPWAAPEGSGLGLGLGALPPPTPVSLTRSSTGFVEGWGGEERPAPALARTVTGLGYAVAESEEEADGEAAPALPGLGPCSAEEESLLVRLSNLRLSLKERQDAVYSEDCRSHDEMAAQDAEWTELENKIDAIEALLRSFGVVLREA
jgi:hypothetical protein